MKLININRRVRYKTIHCFRLVLFVIFFIGLSATCFGQDLKYREVYDIIIKTDKTQAYGYLTEYIKTDTNTANAYYRLGMICSEWVHEKNPFTETQDIRYLIMQAFLYFSEAKNKTDEKEARRNREYYNDIWTNGDDKILSKDILNDIDKRVAHLQEFEKNFNIITGFFNKSIDCYNKCQRLFITVNENNNRITDIYLNTAATLLYTLDEIALNYDSSKIYLTKCIEAAKIYPLKTNISVFRTKTIGTYRLDGLTGTNFLDSSPELWDYRTWVEEIKEILDRDIKDMRASIDIIDEQMKQKILEIKNSSDFYKGDKPGDISLKTINMINKYDYQSIVLDIFNYNQAKINLLNKLHNPINNISDSTLSIDLIIKARYFYDLAVLRAKCDSLGKVLGENITPSKTEKHIEFISKKYKGVAGLKEYIQQSAIDNAAIEQDCYRNLLTFICYEQQLNDDSSKYILYNYNKLLLYPRLLNDSGQITNTYVSSSVCRDKDGNKYLCGYFKGAAKQSVAFVSKLTASDKLEWLKTYDLKNAQVDYEDFGSLIKPEVNGCSFLIISRSETNGEIEIQNTIISLDSKGRELYKREFFQEAICRNFWYNELDKSLAILLKGTSIENNGKNSENVVFMQYSAEKPGAITTEFKLTGNLTDLIFVDGKFLITGGFSTYTLPGKEAVLSKAVDKSDNLNVFSLIADEYGKIIYAVRYSSKDNLYLIKGLKIYSNAILLLCSDKNPETLNYLNSQEKEQLKLTYLLLDSKGRLISSNIAE